MNSQQNIIKYKIADFDLNTTLDCGQCFRWERVAHGAFEGVAFSKKIKVTQQGDSLIFDGTDENDFNNIWLQYFDLRRDYNSIKKELAKDEVLSKAIAFAPGIRLIKQEPWEAMCSFIISQNNNIPRIKGIISRLCESFGVAAIGGGYTFPTAERLAMLNEQELAPIRSGFRAGYILDAAKKVASGEIDLNEIDKMPVDEARYMLRKIKGVGPKVAECVLLYGFGKLECFPVDVWIKRVLTLLYPQGFPPEFSEFAGIAQQYLFYYARCCPDAKLA